MPPAGFVSPSGSIPAPVATLESFKSAYDINVAWPATRELLDDLVEGPPCPLVVIIGHIADGAASVRTLETEREALQGRVTKLESEAREW